MERVDTAGLDNWMSPAAVKGPLGKALGVDSMALNYYELAPGDSFAFGYHAHESQEEVFYVLEGTVVFETDDGDVEVGADEAIRFSPGEFQRGVNEGSERVRAIAIGAPADPGELTVYVDCEACGDRTENEIRPTESKDALVTVCGECGAETGRHT